ncbi:MAG: apolipoprotein N-acyltransferase [Gammaproteobacteria bacterium]|nr:apolipoprotein N-acyltransferase [Gammaproteobacteria bacterium]
MPLISYIGALLAGAVLPLAFAPFSLFPVAIIAPAILFYLLLNATPKQAAKLTYSFGLGLFGVGVSWVYVAFHDFGYTSIGLSIFMTALFVAVLALFYAVQGYCSGKLSEKINAHQYAQVLKLLIIFPTCWGLAEWIRGWFLTGFPWLSLGYSLPDTPLAGYAPLLGVFGVSWLGALTAGALVLVIKQQNTRPWLISGIILIWIAGFLLDKIEWTVAEGKTINVSIIQGNVPQITKWDPSAIQGRLDTYAQLTRESWDSDLIIWPENAMTTFYNDLVEHYFRPLVAEAREHKTDLIVGTPYLDDDGERYYSSLISLGQQEVIYNKRHLVPFGEFVPLQGVLRGLIGFFDLPMSGFSRGEKAQAPLYAAGNYFAPSVCYEDAFGEELIDFLPQATILVNGSNNAWYGNSFAPHQHLEISRMRSIETGRMLLRATTNGISAIIDQKGRVVARTPQFETAILKGTIQPYTGSTPYIIYGNWLIITILFLLLIAVLLFCRRQPEFC